MGDKKFELKEGGNTCPISLSDSRSEPAMGRNSPIRGQRHVFLMDLVGTGVRSPQQLVPLQQEVVEGSLPLQEQNGCQPCPSTGFSLCLYLSGGLTIVWSRVGGSSRHFQKGRRNPRRKIQDQRCPSTSSRPRQGSARLGGQTHFFTEYEKLPISPAACTQVLLISHLSAF